MGQQYIAILARDENFDFTVVVEHTPELEEKMRRRVEMVKSLTKEDAKFCAAQFDFYEFDVYEDLDLGETFDNGDVAFLEGPLDLGEPARKDYGAMVAMEDNSVFFRFGIKHIPDLFESSILTLPEKGA